jgi:hypothetical protein
MPQGNYQTENNAEQTGNVVDIDTWENFNNTDLITESDYVVCEGPSNLAYDVLNKYGIICNSPSIGGDLADLDIKRMDARTVINMSLIHYSAIHGRGYFYEAMVSPDGQVEFIPIGGVSGNISDIYYEIQVGQYKDEAAAIMVTGGKPLVVRKPLVWQPIWGNNPTRIYNMKDMLDNCHREAFSRYATIVFKDPQLTSSYNDGIDNLYDIDDSNPWDAILGYAIYKEPPKNLVTKDTKISYANQTSIPIIIGDDQATENGPFMGTLQELIKYDPNIYNGECWAGQGNEVNALNGVRVNVPTDLRYETIRGIESDLLIGVSAVYLVGLDVDRCFARPIQDSFTLETMTEENSTLMLSINNIRKTTRKLDEGRDYAVAYLEEDGQRVPYIVFGKDTRVNDNYSYGHDTTYFLDPTSEYSEYLGGDFNQIYVGTVFPYSKTKGILVTEIWVYVDVETPCVVIEDPNGITAEGTPRCLEIAQQLKYYVAPIVIEEKRAPIGYRGPGLTGPLNQLPLHDNDPTTAENFEDTEIEIAMDNMQGAGMALTFAFLKDDDYEQAKTQCQNMAEILYDHMNSSVTETVYTCGPNCNPQLGGSGNSGGVINSIRYSYSDQGSYTVSVTEGPYMVGGLSPVDGGPTAKMNEDVGATGIVIDGVGDNMTFKVRIDGFGDRWAISMTHDIIRIGDKVSVTIHNCPIEQ